MLRADGSGRRSRQASCSGRRNASRFATIVCTGWSFWLSVVIRTRTVPRDGCSLDGVTAMISQCRCSVSPGRTGRGPPQLVDAAADDAVGQRQGVDDELHRHRGRVPSARDHLPEEARLRGRLVQVERLPVELAGKSFDRGGVDHGAHVRREHLPRREIFEIGLGHRHLRSRRPGHSLARAAPAVSGAAAAPSCAGISAGTSPAPSRHRPGVMPVTRLNARLNAASDS